MTAIAARPVSRRAAHAADRLHHDGDDHAGARHHDRQRGAALHAGLALRLADQISWVLTSYIVAAAVMTAPVGWLSDRFGRKKLFHRLRRRLHDRIAPVRARAEHRADRRVPPAAGDVRRRAGAALAIGDARCLSDRAARPGDGHLGRRRHARADHGPDARRLADRELLLALGVSGQSAGRHPDGDRPARVHGRDQASGASAVRLVRLPRARRAASARCSSCSIAASSSAGSDRPRSSRS